MRELPAYVAISTHKLPVVFHKNKAWLSASRKCLVVRKHTRGGDLNGVIAVADAPHPADDVDSFVLVISVMEVRTSELKRRRLLRTFKRKDVAART